MRFNTSDCDVCYIVTVRLGVRRSKLIYTSVDLSPEQLNLLLPCQTHGPSVFCLGYSDILRLAKKVQGPIQ